jgi:hypothetical protein
MYLTVRIPANTRAEVVLPVATATGVTLDGAPLGQSTSVNGRTSVELTSGEYLFDLPAPAS